MSSRHDGDSGSGSEREPIDPARLETLERQLRFVTDAAPVLIAHCDRSHRFKFVNKPYAARFGLQPSDLVTNEFLDTSIKL